MLDAYLDESGIHDGAPVCVIAGYFGGRGQLKRMEDEWRKALSDFDVPLEEFHAKDIFPKVKGFFREKGWDIETRNRFLARLAHVVSAYKKISAVSSSVVVQDFEALSLPQRRFFTGARLDDRGKLVTTGSPNRPYFLPFLNCVRRVTSYAPEGGMAKGKAHFFFGLDRPFAGYATALYRDIGENWQSTTWRHKLGNIAFPLAKETPQL
jgi:hypothetical protein